MLLFITINYSLSSAILQVYFTIFSVHLCKKTKFTPCASFWDFAPIGATKALRPWNPTGKVPVPNTSEPGKAFRLSLREGEAPVETGMVVQERHTAPVGAKPAFLPGMTSTAKPHGGMEGGAPEKYPQLLAIAKSPEARGRREATFWGEGTPCGKLPPEVTRGTSRC